MTLREKSRAACVILKACRSNAVRPGEGIMTKTIVFIHGAGVRPLREEKVNS